MSQNSKTFFLPTLKACRDYNVARVPTRGHPARDTIEEINDLKEERGTLDFIRFGRQFSDNWMKRTFQRITGSDVPPLYRNLLLRSFQGNPEGNEEEISTLHIDEIIIEAIGNIPYVVEFKDGQRVYKTGEKTRTVQRNVPIRVRDDFFRNHTVSEQVTSSIHNNEKVLANFRIMVEDESYKINHSHQWEPPGGNIISQVLDTATDIGNRVERATSVATDSEGNFRPLKNYKLDIADRYTGSQQPNLNFKFNLFTKDDFKNDIFMPLIILLYYSSPKRQGAGLGEFVQRIIDTLKEVLDDDISEQLDDAINDDNLDMSDLEALSKIHPGFRLLVTDPPSFFRVRHSSGIFEFPRMAMTKINYTFKKPFYNTKLENFVDIIFSSKVKRQEMSFPTHAEVEITMEALDPMFSEDFTNMLNKMTTEFEQKIKIISTEEDDGLVLESEEERVRNLTKLELCDEIDKKLIKRIATRDDPPWSEEEVRVRAFIIRETAGHQKSRLIPPCVQPSLGQYIFDVRAEMIRQDEDRYYNEVNSFEDPDTRQSHKNYVFRMSRNL